MHTIAAFGVRHTHIPRLVEAATYGSTVHAKLLLLYAGQSIRFTSRQAADVLLLARKSRVPLLH